MLSVNYLNLFPDFWEKDYVELDGLHDFREVPYSAAYYGWPIAKCSYCSLAVIWSQSVQSSLGKSLEDYKIQKCPKRKK